MQKQRILLMCVVVVLPLFVVLGDVLPRNLKNPSLRLEVARTPSVTTVMTIGGSVAHGWDDTSQGGYLHRTFNSLTAVTNTTYTFYDKTIIGANAVQLQETLYKGSYEKWLNTYDPNIVVISWGLLNDCLPNTPMDKFDQYVTQEINEALAHKAVVYVVSPPVTAASYTKYKVKEQSYVNEEQAIVKRINNPNVYFIDVFNQMKQYLIEHHQTVQEFGTNTWHPNSMGHIIATHLLLKNIRSTLVDSAPASLQS